MRARFDSLTRRLLVLTTISILGLFPAAAFAQTARIELHPLQTVTLTGEQFLTGVKDGKPALISGELRIPRPGAERLPAVVLVHGSGGVGANVDRWAQELNGIGVSAFIVDSFTGRGIVNTAADQSQLSSLGMMVDAFRALELLGRHSRVDPARIGVMGFSKGGVTSTPASNGFSACMVRRASSSPRTSPCTRHATSGTSTMSRSATDPFDFSMVPPTTGSLSRRAASTSSGFGAPGRM